MLSLSATYPAVAQEPHVLSAKSKTGFKGVSKDGGKYEAKITENGTSRHLGNFATPEEAALCYARHVNTL
jgi:hypothetical protein